MPRVTIDLDEQAHSLLAGRMASVQALSETGVVSDALSLLAECERTAEGRALILQSAARAGFLGAEDASAVQIQTEEEWGSFWNSVRREVEAEDFGSAPPHAKTAA